jgi:hypothetical protein
MNEVPKLRLERVGDHFRRMAPGDSFRKIPVYLIS